MKSFGDAFLRPWHTHEFSGIRISMKYERLEKNYLNHETTNCQLKKLDFITNSTTFFKPFIYPILYLEKKSQDISKVSWEALLKLNDFTTLHYL